MNSKQSFDDVLSVIEIEGLTKVQTLSILYVAYKLNKLSICINKLSSDDRVLGKIHVYHAEDIHKINMNDIKGKLPGKAVICCSDPGISLSALSYDTIFKHLEENTFECIFLVYKSVINI